LRFLHPITAVIAGLFVCWLVLRSVPRTGERKLAIGVLSLLALQCVLGFADVVLLTPLWLQITHLFVADLLWITLVVLAARICVVPRMQVAG
jgi:cytochrome c oxidase assembly protein subunit 15